LLRAKNWRAANQETTTLLREIIDGQRESWLDQKSLQLLETLALSQDSLYPELKTIDSLWRKYSNDRFGFSVQKRVFLESGGKRFDKEERVAIESFEKFGDRVGWREKAEWFRNGQRQWIPYNKLTFNDLSPRGHLPLPRVRFTGFLGAMTSIGDLPSQSKPTRFEIQSSAILILQFGFWVSGTECD
jgi:eukaryotic-like serine/threonine-protein kinase